MHSVYIDQCFGDPLGKEVLVLMFFILGGAILANVSDLLQLCVCCLFFELFPGLPLQGYNSLLVM